MSEWSAEQRERARASLPRLLSGHDALSRDEADAIFKNVMASVDQERRPGRLRWFYGLAASATAAVVVVGLQLGGEDTLTARGGATDQERFATACVTQGVRGPCRSGSTLLFELGQPTDKPFFSSFAERSDGVVVWYFPAADGGSVDARSLVDGVATTGFVLGAEHSVGRYRVFGVFSARPLSRAELQRLDESAFTETTLVVEP